MELDWNNFFVHFLWMVKEIAAISAFLMAIVMWLGRKNLWSKSFLPKAITVFVALWLTGVVGYLFFRLGFTSHLPSSWLPFFDDKLVFWFLVGTLGAALPIFSNAILFFRKSNPNI